MTVPLLMATVSPSAMSRPLTLVISKAALSPFGSSSLASTSTVTGVPASVVARSFLATGGTLPSSLTVMVTVASSRSPSSSIAT